MQNTLPTDFLLDYETFGLAPEGAAIDLAIVCFKDDPHNPPTFQELVNSGLKIKFDVKDQTRYGRVIDASTMEWWKNQSESARAEIRPRPDDLSLVDGLDKVAEFLKSSGVDSWKSHGWCRGPSFDFSIMTTQLRQRYDSRDGEAFNSEWCKFWNQRDCRTGIEATLMMRDMTECPLPMGTLEGFVAHNSIHDCAKDILMLLYAKRYALGLEDCPAEHEADPRSIKKAR